MRVQERLARRDFQLAVKAAYTAVSSQAFSRLNMQDLATENRMLKQALEEKRLMMGKKALLKERKMLEQLRLKRRLQEAEAENKELKGAAKQVV